MKNKINKILSICLVALTLAISVVGVGATQSNSKAVISAKAGETVKANVYITENSGIVSLDFSVVFDENALTLIEITNTGLLTGAAYTPPQKDMDANAYHSPATPVWISTSTSNITTTGTLLALEFVVNADATAGEYPITIEGVVATDVNLAEPTSLVVTSDTIKVTSGEVEPTEPQPTEPQPTEPQPTEPQPTEPQPTEPQPTEPTTEPTPDLDELVSVARYETLTDSEGEEYNYKYPKVNIDSDYVDSVNNEIKSYCDEIIDKQNENGHISTIGMDYEAYINGDILSLVVTDIYYYGEISSLIYNINIPNGTEVKQDYFASYLNVSIEELDNLKTYTKLSFFDERFPIDSFTHDGYYDTQRERIVSGEFDSNDFLYFNENNKIYLYCTIPSMAGADYYNHHLKLLTDTLPTPTEPTTDSGTETTDSNDNNATNNGSSTNGTTQSGKVATGDNTPIFIILGILLVSGLVIVVNKKRKLN